MPNKKSAPSGRAWKLERASVHKRGQARPKSNKYAKADTDQKPQAGARSRVWVGGYTRADGVKVEGYYRGLGSSDS